MQLELSSVTFTNVHFRQQSTSNHFGKSFLFLLYKFKILVTITSCFFTLSCDDWKIKSNQSISFFPRQFLWGSVSGKPSLHPSCPSPTHTHTHTSLSALPTHTCTHTHRKILCPPFPSPTHTYTILFPAHTHTHKHSLLCLFLCLVQNLWARWRETMCVTRARTDCKPAPASVSSSEAEIRCAFAPCIFSHPGPFKLT